MFLCGKSEIWAGMDQVHDNVISDSVADDMTFLALWRDPKSFHNSPAIKDTTINLKCQSHSEKAKSWAYVLHLRN
jgi:hypothetical protein